MRVVIDRRGVIQSEGDATEDPTCTINMPVRFTHDCTYASGVVNHFEGSTRTSVTLIAGTGVTITRGPSYGDYIISATGTSAGPSDIRREIPTGSVDGSNGTFTLSSQPDPPESLQLFRNGLALLLDADFTLSGTTVTFPVGNVPTSGSILWTRYSTTGGTTGRDVIPTDGVTATFTLASAPNPPSSLLLFRNGLAMLEGLDFTLSGAAVSFPAGNIPASGSIMWASYQL